MDMDLDGFIKLSDANIRESMAPADILGKLASAELTWQQAQHQSLVNLAKQLDIEWNEQAHKQLRRMINLKLQAARLQRTDAEHFKDSTAAVNRLMSGDVSLTAATSGWIGFGYLRSKIALGAAMLPVPDDKFVYDRISWDHPGGWRSSSGEPGRDPGSVLRWARINNLYPVAGGPAWLWLGGYLAKLGEAAAAEAAKIDARVQATENAALELERRDWDRLNAKPDKPE